MLSLFENFVFIVCFYIFTNFCRSRLYKEILFFLCILLSYKNMTDTIHSLGLIKVIKYPLKSNNLLEFCLCFVGWRNIW